MTTAATTDHRRRDHLDTDTPHPRLAQRPALLGARCAAAR